MSARAAGTGGLERCGGHRRVMKAEAWIIEAPEVLREELLDGRKRDAPYALEARVAINVHFVQSTVGGNDPFSIRADLKTITPIERAEPRGPQRLDQGVRIGRDIGPRERLHDVGPCGPPVRHRV